jgi:hypothetical protein
MIMNIENVLPGILYKTNDINKAEAFREYLRGLLETDIIFDMSGPMVDSILINSQSCSKVAKKLGNFILTPKTGTDQMTFNITSFMRDTKSGCQLYMSILVFSGADDQIVLGQMLMYSYNVTLDYD